ncbi:MAG: hypothetical protein RLZZ293_900 [Pseudomonadota bacterium]|jgi:anti-anti-sigma factor
MLTITLAPNLTKHNAITELNRINSLLRRQKTEKIIFDAINLVNIDSAGIAVLIELKQQTQHNNVNFNLINLSPLCFKLFQLYNIYL